jgi:nitrile hydratase subunit beta
MNGVHDMGGMQDMGPIRQEKNEPVFHARWEGRIYALNMALGAWGKWTLDAARHANDSLPPADYLAMSYYQKWYVRMLAQLVQAGMVTPGELETGRPARGTAKSIPPLTADKVASVIAIGASKKRNVAATPLFKVGQQVRARNLNLPTHTRLPRYARGKVGIVERDQGVFVFPDTNAHGLGEKPQHVYSVRFTAPELWGDQARPRDAVYIDMWDDYLEPV